MKILILCSGNYDYSIKPYINEQAEAISKSGIEIKLFLIKGKGMIGYLKNLPAFLKTIRQNNYDLIHAHTG